MPGDHRPSTSSQKLTQRLDIDFALQAAGLGVWELDPATDQVLWDDRCQGLFGLAKVDCMPYEQALQHIHAEDVDRIREAILWAMQPQSGGVYDQTFRTIGADDGTLRWVRFYGKSYFSETGEVYRFAGVAQEVTSQVQTQQRETTAYQQAQRQQRIYEAITASTPDLMYVFDLDYRFTYANQALLTMWGKTWEASIGKSLLENGYEPWHAEMHEREIDQVVATKQPIRGEVSFPHATLGKRIYDYVFAPVLNERGEVEAVAGTTRDITDLKQAQERVVERETYARRLIDTVPAIIWTTEPDGSCSFLNRQWYDYTGQEEAQALGSGWLDATHPEDKEASGKRFIEANEQHVSFDLLYRLRRHDGTYHWAIDKGSPRFGPNGEYLGMIGTVIDVHDQKLAEEALRSSEMTLRTIVSTAPVAIGLFVGRDLVVQSPNQTFIDIVGKGPDIVGKPLREVMPELITENQPFLQILDDVFTTGERFHSYGSQVDIVQNGVMTHNIYNITYSPIFDAEGKVYAILDIAVDVTGEAKTQQALKESQRILESMIHLAELGTYTIDLADNRLVKSPRVAGWYGIPEVTDVATSIGAIQESDQERVSQLFTDALRPGSEGIYQMEYTVINAQTKQKYILQTVGQVRWDLEGQPTHVDGLVRDITFQHEVQLALERQVQQRTEELEATNEELAATNEELLATNEDFLASNQALEMANLDLARSNENLQQFAYIASHDLQEPLRKIQSFGDVLKAQYRDELGNGVDLLDRMQVAASRMSLLIRDLLAFSRISTRQAAAQPVALGEVVQQVLETLSVIIDESEAQIQVDPLPVVQGDASQLSQLFQNLLSNALKFRRTSASGEPIVPQITLRVSLLPRHQLPASLQPARHAEACYLIAVADNGIGFDERYKDRIFQVFQRLHGRHEYAGTGVGLAIVQKVATNHGGAITATGKPGEGATFWVYLPA